VANATNGARTRLFFFWPKWRTHHRIRVSE
jgi:hypothetical protein